MKIKNGLVVALGGLALILAVSGVAVGHPEDSDPPAVSADKVAPDTEDARIIKGFLISPVPVKLHARDRDLIGLGSYIVNSQGGCNDCHTNPSYKVGGDPFRGQPKQVNAEHFLAGGQAFGPFTSRNLTPEANGLPAGLTFVQFREVMRTGVDFDNAHPQISPLLQVMPWPTYQSMGDRDLMAIYEYLRAIPHAEPGQ
jgi:hypothetical protein